jgi:quinol monooxygenase YgiN
MSRLAFTGATLMFALAITPAMGALPASNHNEVSMNHCCLIVELRQYTLYPGKRDELISLFEEHFIESQEDAGMRIVAQFRDLADANRFVWVRGFAGMQARHDALTSFYYGPVWQAHRNQANATLEDNDNVLLLHPASPQTGFGLDLLARPAKGAAAANGKLIVATIYYLQQGAVEQFAAAFDRDMSPLVEQSGARVLAQYVSEKGRNTFERLPVREKESVFVLFAAFENAKAYDRHLQTLALDERWHAAILAHARIMERAPETLLLLPTARSLIR